MDTRKIKRMYILSFLFALHISISAYVNSSFLAGIIKEEYVGILYTVASLITLMLLSKSSSFLKFFGNKRLTLWLLLANMLSLVGMITSKNPYVVCTSFIVFTTTNTQILFCIDIFIEHFTNRKTIGKSRGFFLMFINLAWMISPLISAFLITKEGGYVTIYLLAFIITILMTIGLLFSVKTFKDRTYERTPFWETYKYLKKNNHMLSITVINFILQFFYAWMVVYTPIYLHQYIGLGWSQIGIVFTMMLSPFVIFNLPIGILMDKYRVGKKLLLSIGFIVMALSTMVIAGVNVKYALVWGILLFMTRVGACIIETTSEVYFFTHIKEEEAYLLSVFRDMVPVAYIIAPLLGTLVFLFLPFNSLFLILGVIVLSGLFYVTKLKNDHEIILSDSNK